MIVIQSEKHDNMFSTFQVTERLSQTSQTAELQREKLEQHNVKNLETANIQYLTET
jgi:hypothetical protein